MLARKLIVAVGLTVGLLAAGGLALDDTHSAHAPAKAAAKPASPKADPHQTDAPKASATKAPAEFGIGAATPKKDPAAAPTKTTVDAVDGPVSVKEALRLLRDGNERWINSRSANPAGDTSRRQLTDSGQHPFATILTCADSRLPVERIFDRGVGELFVLRVAGNVVGTNEAGTIEYGAAHLNVPLLVVMGHTRCGAVAAASTTGHDANHEVPPNIAGLLTSIEPAVMRARKANPDAEAAELAAAAVRENVWQSIFDLIRFSGPVRAQLREGKLTIVGAVCDVADGKVQWLGEHPWQEELVNAFDASANTTTGVAAATAHEETSHEDAAHDATPVASHPDSDH